MKARILMVCLAALALGGCTTYYDDGYVGATGYEYGTVHGTDTDADVRVDPYHPSWVNPHRPDMGRGSMAVPVYRHGSPSGTDPLEARPDIIFYR